MQSLQSQKENAAELSDKDSTAWVDQFWVRTLLIIVIACCIFLLLLSVPLRMSPNPEARLEAMDFYKSIRLDDSQDKVHQSFLTKQYKFLTLEVAEPDLWLVRSPFELGAGNLILWIGFNNSQVSTLRMRNADGMDIKPLNAPEDKSR